MQKQTVRIIADSYNQVYNSRIVTWEIDYWRAIHAELMTHRLFSKNAASSRAIPIDKSIEFIRDNDFGPQYWGANKSGMQAAEEVQNPELAKVYWNVAKGSAIAAAIDLKNAGLHKQIVNRVLEPFSNIKVVMTSTNHENFWWLRNHKDAQPELQALAKEMQKLYDKSNPESLTGGEWHLPYIRKEKIDGQQLYYVDTENDSEAVDLSTAKKISVSCCAQVSYRKNDNSSDKAEDIYKKLIESEPCHASPTEHQATPIVTRRLDKLAELLVKYNSGVTHIDKHLVPWSGNFHGWIQNRQLIPGNAKYY